MTKYNVHIYPIICVTVCDVEAESQVEAIKRAEARTDLGKLFGAGLIQYADDVDGFLVDEAGDTVNARSTWYDKEYRPS